MPVLTVKGTNVREALLHARQALGDHAVVVSRMDTPSGTVIAVAPEVPRSPQALEALRHEARRLLGRPQAHASQVGTREVERCLGRAGASRQLTERTCEAVAGRLAEGLHPLDLAAEELSVAFPVAQLKRRRGAKTVLALVGTAGAGKSTTAAKLAGRMQAAGRTTALVTIDLDRPGARAQAATNGRTMGVPVAPAREASRVARLFEAEPSLDCVVLDMTGRPEHDLEQLEGLRAALLQSPVDVDLVVLGVLPMTSSRRAQERFLGQVATASLDAVVVTKTDECDVPAPTLELCSERRLPVAFLSNGRDLGKDLRRASGEALADLILRGRVS